MALCWPPGCSPRESIFDDRGSVDCNNVANGLVGMPFQSFERELEQLIREMDNKRGFLLGRDPHKMDRIRAIKYFGPENIIQ